MKRVNRCRRRRISSFFGIFQSFVMFSLLLLRGTVRLTVSGSGHGLDRGRQYKAGGDIARTQARLCSCCRWTWTWHHQAKRGLPACPSRKRTSTGRAEWLLFGGNSGSFDWYERIIAGEVGTIKTLCKITGLGRTYVKAILRCATLSPQIVESILLGKHRPGLTLQDLRHGIPIDWQEQQDRIFQLSQAAKTGT